MTIDARYDADNIFAKIIRGDAPATKVFEDDNLLAFMDLFPQAEGHALVIHKHATAVNLLDVEPTHLSELIAGVQRLARAVRAGLELDGVRVVQFNGAPAGQTVFHLHFHIIPVYEARAERPHAAGGQADAGALEATAAKIRAAL